MASPTSIQLDELATLMARMECKTTGLVEKLVSIKSAVDGRTSAVSHRVDRMTGQNANENVLEFHLSVGGNPGKLEPEEVQDVLRRWNRDLVALPQLPQVTLCFSNRSFSVQAVQEIVSLVKRVAYCVVSLEARNILFGQDSSLDRQDQDATRVGFEAMRLLANALQHAGNLQSIDFSQNALGPLAIRNIRKILTPSLTKINLNDTGIDADCLVTLREALLEDVAQCDLQELRCSQNGFDDEGGREIGLLLPFCPDLQVLDCGYCRLGREGCRSIAIGLQSLHNLCELDLACCTLGNTLDGPLGPLCEALRSMPMLAKLSLSDCGLDVGGLSFINGSLIQSEAQLVGLNLDWLELVASGLPTLNEFLNRYAATLEHLSLSGIDLGCEGLTYLMPVLSGCNKLESVDLSENDLGPDAVPTLLSLGNPWKKLVLAANGLEDDPESQNQLLQRFYNVDFGEAAGGYDSGNDGWLDTEGNVAADDEQFEKVE